MQLVLPIALLLLLLVVVGVGVVQAQPFDYPSVRPSTTWANTDASLPHHATYADGSVARAALLRLNPAGYGPSYAFGFFCTATSTNHHSNNLASSASSSPCAEFVLGVAVVYCNSGGLMTSLVAGVPQVVWSAANNRGLPVRVPADGAAASAELTADGDLVLRSGADGSVVWSSGTTGRSVAAMSVTGDGNLVLLDARNNTVWQSFDHPTDALLVGQSLRPGARLVANSSSSPSSSSRLLYLAVADDGLSAYVAADPPQRYYHLGFTSAHAGGAYAAYANGSLAVFDDPAASAAGPLATIQLPAVGGGTVQYMRLEHDGNLRVYEWRSVFPSGWAPVFDVLRVFPDGCAFPTVCGAYGVCSTDDDDDAQAQCSCPDAADFRAVDFRRPNRGCVPVYPAPSCGGGPGTAAAARVVSLPGLAYFNDPATSLRALERVSDAACRRACLDECRCAAAQFVYGADDGDGFCYLQSEVLSLQTSRPEVVHYNSTMHLKVQQQQQQQATRRPASTS